MSTTREVIDSASAQVAFDCGCPGLYYCPSSADLGCPGHSGFDVCCDRPGEHVLVPGDLRTAHPRPPLPPGEADES